MSAYESNKMGIGGFIALGLLLAILIGGAWGRDSLFLLEITNRGSGGTIGTIIGLGFAAVVSAFTLWSVIKHFGGSSQ